MSVRDLPTLNAALNATAALLLIWGYTLVRRKRVDTHRRVMLSAFGVSVAFLLSYLFYHYQVGSVRFGRTGTIRTVYLSILLTHTVLAAAVPFLAVASVWRGWTGNYEAHRKVARWTLPIWLYVSISGVVVYGMLYHL
jgi:uncharacterized membrane protein YozB (DUF420 family)